MNKEYLEALEKIKQEFNCDPEYYGLGGAFEILESALYRLESIDNAEPSEALEDSLKRAFDYGVQSTLDGLLLRGYNTKTMLEEQCCGNTLEKDLDEAKTKITNLATIQQALQKQQELPEPFKTGVDIGVIKPKQYLKWEDLEFNHTPKMIDVKMSGNKYKLVVGYNVAGKNLAILRDGKKEYYFLECDKQFFNDLHLERVEE